MRALHKKDGSPSPNGLPSVRIQGVSAVKPALLATLTGFVLSSLLLTGFVLATLLLLTGLVLAALLRILLVALFVGHRDVLHLWN